MAWSAKLLSCTKTDCLDLPRTSWSAPLERLASNSWFTVRMKTVKGPATLPKTSSPSQPCLLQVITESEARKTAELQAKSEARKRAREKRAREAPSLKNAKEQREERQKKTYENSVRARRIRVYPTPDQEKVILSWFGVCRFFNNLGVEVPREGT